MYRGLARVAASCNVMRGPGSDTLSFGMSRLGIVISIKACALAAGFLGACTGSPTQIGLVIDTDLLVPSEVDRVVVDIQSEFVVDGERSGDTVEVDLSQAGANRLPLTLAVKGGRSGASFLVSASARRGDLEVVSRRASVDFVQGEVRTLEMPLTRECASVCCNADETCDAGQCVSTQVSAVDLPKWNGKKPERLGASECVLGGVEACNGFDDDCDNEVDEDFDFGSDNENCGRCGHVCRGGGRCISGICEGERLVSIAAGEAHTCVAQEAGGVACWGRNVRGALGDGTTFDRLVPQTFGIGPAIAKVVAGSDFTCALTQSGSVACWGRGDLGQLGNGGTRDSPVAVEVQGLGSNVQDIAAGEAHACAVLGEGSVACWGDNASAQLGTGANGRPSLTPVLVSDLQFTAERIAAGGAHTCATATSGGVFCWGANDQGQSGGEGAAPSPRMVPGLGGTNASRLSAGVNHSCAVAGGSVFCWGAGSDGQLGAPELQLQGSRSAVQSEGLEGVVALDASGTGSAFNCSVESDGEVRCWGANEAGQVGDGTTDTRARASRAQVGRSTGVATGGSHSCATLLDGRVACWGSNEAGQLGLGDRSSRIIPTPLRCL